MVYILAYSRTVKCPVLYLSRHFSNAPPYLRLSSVPTLELSRRIYCRSRSTYPRLIVDPCREFVAADLTENGHRRATRLYERSSPRIECFAVKQCAESRVADTVCRGSRPNDDHTPSVWQRAVDEANVAWHYWSVTRRPEALSSHIDHVTFDRRAPNPFRKISTSRGTIASLSFPCLLIKAALKGNNRKPLTTLIPCKYAWLRSITTLVHCNCKE